MLLRYDEDLVESVVFLCASGRGPAIAPLQRLRYQAERERLYRILDPDERNNAFFALHLDWFREWGLDRTLRDLAGEFPLLAATLRDIVFRKARRQAEEGAELYVNDLGERHGVVAVLPERLVAGAPLRRLLHHELTHLSDMVDPAFGYQRALHLPGRTASQQRLARERYRLLWDITIDGRLSRAGRVPLADRAQRELEFDRAFAFLPDDSRLRLFESLWSGRQPRHEALLALASDPRDLAASAGPVPGAPCPLCGCSTFTWAEAAALPEPVLASIGREFPSWQPAHGVCRRCVEVYESAFQFAPPPTVVL
jgi:hypothetical protein